MKTTYQAHDLGNNVVAQEVVTNPVCNEKIGTCHMYYMGDYRWTAASLEEAKSLKDRAAYLC